MTDTPLNYFLQGFAAAEAGASQEACPLLFDAWPRQAWLEGHQFAEDYSGVRLLKTDGPLQRVAADPYQQGNNAFIRGRPIEACPYEPESQDWRNWRIGWYTSRNFEIAKEKGRREEWDRNCGLRRLAIALYLALILAVVLIVWALATHGLPFTTSSAKLVACQAAKAPWLTGECL